MASLMRAGAAAATATADAAGGSGSGGGGFSGTAAGSDSSDGAIAAAAPAAAPDSGSTRGRGGRRRRRRGRVRPATAALLSATARASGAGHALVPTPALLAAVAVGATPPAASWRARARTGGAAAASPSAAASTKETAAAAAAAAASAAASSPPVVPPPTPLGVTASTATATAFAPGVRAALADRHPPFTYQRRVARYTSPAYGGIYYAGGRGFITSCQDMGVRVYETAGWGLRGLIVAMGMRWTITDIAVGGEGVADDGGGGGGGGAWLAYSTISRDVRLSRLADVTAAADAARGEEEEEDDGDALGFDSEEAAAAWEDEVEDRFEHNPTRRRIARGRGDRRRRGGRSPPMVQPPPQRTLTVPTASTEADYGDHRNTAVWSLAASPSGASLTAGTGTCRVVTMDVESGAATFTGIGHTDDVNAVAYLHPGREDVMVSGADDGAVRLWDWRAGERSVGHFAGHVEGITSVGVRGDGRYLVSNGKDQAVKLWDVRVCGTVPAVGGGGGRNGGPMGGGGRGPHGRPYDYRCDVYTGTVPGGGGGRRALGSPWASSSSSCSGSDSGDGGGCSSGVEGSGGSGSGGTPPPTSRRRSARLAGRPRPPRRIDHSVLTFSGSHSTLQTLIRARFSPPPTGGRWVAVGSADGAVVVYDILGDGFGRRLRWCGDPGEDGEEEDECGGGGGRGGRRARTATPLVRLFRPRLLWAGGGGRVVRDVSWAPDGSALVGVGWDGGVCMWGARRGGSGLQSI